MRFRSSRHCICWRELSAAAFTGARLSASSSCWTPSSRGTAGGGEAMRSGSGRKSGGMNGGAGVGLGDWASAPGEARCSGAGSCVSASGSVGSWARRIPPAVQIRAQLSSSGFNGAVLRVVGVTGFEPATSWSQTRRSTKLSYTPDNGALFSTRPQVAHAETGRLHAVSSETGK